MHLILPFNKKDKDAFVRSALDMGFDQYVIDKFIFTVHSSDHDVYELMHDERISLLIYGWEVTEVYLQNTRNSSASESYQPSENVCTVLKWLARYSVELWLSWEWENCPLRMRDGLLYCMKREATILAQVPELKVLDWTKMLRWDIRPWQQEYVCKFLLNNSSSANNAATHSIEQIEATATVADIEYLREEDSFIILLRLMKMLDSYYLEGAQHLAMRALAAWNMVFERAKKIPGNESMELSLATKQCLVSICHVYLLTVYEMDDKRGFVIDNMMNNIRFYHQSFMSKHFSKPFDAIATLHFTAARFIALTCFNLGISIDEFFSMFCKQSAEHNFCTMFGIIAQSYVSYILGNQLMHLNSMNEQDFNAQLERYKSLFNAYLREREISELFVRDQLKRAELKRNSHSTSKTIKNLIDFDSKICKGNRSSNIANYKNTDDVQSQQQTPCAYNSDKKTDSIFQNIPNNEEMLKYVYRILAQRSYDGWFFAKIILLLKIIGNEVNNIETWRYHPGLTTDFMLSLETKLAQHYEDLAKIFHEHFFLEQEFWLTAFYLHPINKYYDAVLRCGMRYQRRMQQLDSSDPDLDKSDERVCVNAKYGLLSSTIDVKEIVEITNHDMPTADYDALHMALVALGLPERTIKDLLTVTFLPRNKSYAWAVNWPELRKRCKKLLNYPEHKRGLVELNMAEANDRLKYLNIDYEKYKHRPQLDYGSIEEGYEHVYNLGEHGGATNDDDHDDDDDEDDDEVDDEDGDSDVDAALRAKEEELKQAAEQEKSYYRIHDSETDEDDDDEKNDSQQMAAITSAGTRRTRARTAAAIATAIMTEDRTRKPSKPAAIVLKEDPKPEDVSTEKQIEHAHVEPAPVAIPAVVEDNSNDSQSNLTNRRNLKELLEERPIFSNETSGFQAFPDIWDFDAQLLKTVDKKCVDLSDAERMLQRFAKRKKSSRPRVCKKAAIAVPETLTESLHAIEMDAVEMDAVEMNTAEKDAVEMNAAEMDAACNNVNIELDAVATVEAAISEDALPENSKKQHEDNDDPGNSTAQSVPSITPAEQLSLLESELQVDEVIAICKIEEVGEVEETALNSLKYVDEVFVDYEALLDTNTKTGNVLKEEQVDEESLQTTEEPMKIEAESLKIEPESLEIEPEPLEIAPDSLNIEAESLKLEEESLKIEAVSLKTKAESLTVSDGVDEINATLVVPEECLSADLQQITTTDLKSLEVATKVEAFESAEDDIEDCVESKVFVAQKTDEVDAEPKVEVKFDNVQNETKTNQEETKPETEPEVLKMDVEQIKDEPTAAEGQMEVIEKNVEHREIIEITPNQEDIAMNDIQIEDAQTITVKNNAEEDFKMDIDDKEDDCKNAEESIQPVTKMETDTTDEEQKDVELKNDVELKKVVEFKIDDDAGIKNKDDQADAKTKEDDQADAKTKEDDDKNEAEPKEEEDPKDVEPKEDEEPKDDKEKKEDEPPREEEEPKEDETFKEEDASKESEETEENRPNDVESQQDAEKDAELDEDSIKSEEATPKEVNSTKTKSTAAVDDKNGAVVNDEKPIPYCAKRLVVRLKKLSVADCILLRQPQVRIRRMDCASAMPHSTRLPRAAQTKTYENMCDSDDSRHGSPINTAPKVTKLHKLQKTARKRTHSHFVSTSAGEEGKRRHEKYSRPQQAKRQVPLMQHKKKLIILPASVSGLKMKISSRPMKKRVTDDMELIQISSSSSSPQLIDDSDDDDVHNLINPMTFVNSILGAAAMNSNPNMDDPLYEEEVILCD